MDVREKKSDNGRRRGGSALILAVVLTTLLAIVGLLFVMSSRVERTATAAISENRDLNLAVETVIAQISQELALDVPNMPQGLEYYDYPDVNNLYLASLEPNSDGLWPQISDIYGVLASRGLAWNLPPEIIADHNDTVDVGFPADADGDGVTDSRWIRLPDMTSSKGRPIFVTVRIVDNGAMLNVNTGFKFDPNDVSIKRDGSSLMQINLMALARQVDEPPPTVEYEQDLLEARANYGLGGINPFDLDGYERNVAWRYEEPNGVYTPFDVSDELELRYRFLVNQDNTETVLEALGSVASRPWGFRDAAFRRPADTFDDLPEWFKSASADVVFDPNYAYRHIATTYNMDRIIRPDGGRMMNVNAADANSIYDTIRTTIGEPDAAQIAVNLVDFRDEDSNITALDVEPDGINDYYGFERPCVYISELAYGEDPNTLDYTAYGIELFKPYPEDSDPCLWQVVIDGTAYDITWSGTTQFHVMKSSDPNKILSFGWEEPNGPNPPHEATRVDANTNLSWPGVAGANLYDVYFGMSESDVNESASPVSIGQTSTSYDPCTLEFETTHYWRIDAFDGVNPVATGEVWWFTTGDANTPGPKAQTVAGWLTGETIFSSGSIIELSRPADDGSYVVVDAIQVPEWWDALGLSRSFQRDITLHKCIRRLWAESDANSPTLGHSNAFRDPDANVIQAHPADVNLINIGEIGMVFRRNAYSPVLGAYPPDIMGYGGETGADVVVNPADPAYQQIFSYLTVFDPSFDRINNDGDRDPADGNEMVDEFDMNGDRYPDPGAELKIPGRININTAPWYVIAQLPWITAHTAPTFELAQAIVAYRDRTAVAAGPDYTGRAGEAGFRNIGELNNIDYMYYYALDGVDQLGLPDLTAGSPIDPGDGAVDDLEERDLIFARISNLVTVRSDVFTAYILVRVGPTGPQKRVIAILDRSDVYPDATGGMAGKVKLRALHTVPDPR